MSLQIFTDSSANLPEELLKQRHIQVVTLTVLVNGEELLCYEPDSHFDGNAFYERMRKDDRLELKTSMINTITFIDAFTPALQAGDDVIYIAMSSGISGTYASGRSAAFMLHETFPDRTILAVDTLAASMGEGLQVLEAADMRDRGCSAAEILAYLETRRVSIRQHFLVDDLMFLKRGGRISGTAALAGTIMNIKPIMKADACGRIVLDRKVLGRKKALNALADIFDAYHVDAPENCNAAIAHGGCEDDALSVAVAIKKRHPEMKFTIVCYEPGTGAHVGPGTVALFFWGEERAQKEPVLPNIRAKIVNEADAIRNELHNKLHHED